MVGHGGSSAGSYLADPTSPIPSHCASIVVTSTLRVKQCRTTFGMFEGSPNNNICHASTIYMWSSGKDSRSKGLGFDTHCWSCVKVGQTSHNTASVYPAMMGTWLMKIVSKWLKFPACMYYMCVVYSPGKMRLRKWFVSYTREGDGLLNMAYISSLKLCTFTLLWWAWDTNTQP